MVRGSWNAIVDKGLAALRVFEGGFRGQSNGARGVRPVAMSGPGRVTCRVTAKMRAMVTLMVLSTYRYNRNPVPTRRDRGYHFEFAQPS